MTIKQLQTLFNRLQREAGNRGAVIEARLGGDMDSIVCVVSLLDRPGRVQHIFLSDGISDEYYVRVLIQRVCELTEQVAA